MIKSFNLIASALFMYNLLIKIIFQVIGDQKESVVMKDMPVFREFKEIKDPVVLQERAPKVLRVFLAEKEILDHLDCLEPQAKKVSQVNRA